MLLIEAWKDDTLLDIGVVTREQYNHLVSSTPWGLYPGHYIDAYAVHTEPAEFQPVCPECHTWKGMHARYCSRRKETS